MCKSFRDLYIFYIKLIMIYADSHGLCKSLYLCHYIMLIILIILCHSGSFYCTLEVLRVAQKTGGKEFIAGSLNPADPLGARATKIKWASSSLCEVEIIASTPKHSGF